MRIWHRSITEVTVGLKNYDLFREYGQFTAEELIEHIKVYVDTDNKRAEKNSDMLATCIFASISAGTRSKLHAIYENLKIGGIVYDELFFKGMTKKDISNNKKTTRYLQDQYENLPSYMATCDYNIKKFNWSGAA